MKARKTINRKAAARAINAQIDALRGRPLSIDLLSAFTSSDALDLLDEILAARGGVSDGHIEIAVRFLEIGVLAGAAVEASALLECVHQSGDCR